MSAAVMLPVTHNRYGPAVRRQAETEEEGVWSGDGITSVLIPYEQAVLSGCSQSLEGHTEQNR